MLLGTIDNVTFLGSLKNILTRQWLNLLGTSQLSEMSEVLHKKAQQD